MALEINLSAKQEKLLRYIAEYLDDYGRPPNFREIEPILGVKSTSAVSYQIDRLHKMGLLNREKKVARGLQLTEEATAFLGLDQITETMPYLSTFVHLHVRGDIVAGEPVHLGHDSFASYDEDDVIRVDGGLLPRRRDNLFALRVRGLSMIDALINDGDIVILQQTNEVGNGAMVAAWLTVREEMTLKHIYFEDKNIRLQPANREFDPIILPASEVEVQGKVILMQRQMGN